MNSCFRPNPVLNHPAVRFFVLLCLLTGFLSLSGCVYLRLLSVKNQLAKFDEFFTVKVTESFTLNFLKPKLYSKDITFLLEMQPTHKKILESGEEWTFLFKKMISDTEPAADSNADISFIFRFNQDDSLTSITFSPILLRMAPAEFLELSLRSLGGAKIDKKKRQIRGDTEHLSKLERPLPKRGNIVKFIGNPNSEETVENTELFTYQYRLETEGLTAEQEKNRMSVARLYFDPETHELLRFHGRFAGLKLSINYKQLVDEKFLVSENRD